MRSLSLSLCHMIRSYSQPVEYMVLRNYKRVDQLYGASEKIISVFVYDGSIVLNIIPILYVGMYQQSTVATCCYPVSY